MDFESKISIDRDLFAILENNAVQVKVFLLYLLNKRYGMLKSNLMYKHSHLQAKNLRKSNL